MKAVKEGERLVKDFCADLKPIPSALTHSLMSLSDSRCIIVNEVLETDYAISISGIPIEGVKG